MNRLVVVSAVLVLSCAGYAQLPTYQNLDYVGNGNVRQFLDLYIPPGLAAPAPLVIYIHGGGWQSGSKGNAMQFCDTLLARRYIVADINYRLSSESTFPAQIHDCKAAVRWLKAHASQYNIDTCRIAVTGSSAGGHLASFLATSGGVDSLEDFGLGSTTTTSRVHAAIPFYGVSDILQLDGHVPSTPPDSCTNFLVHSDSMTPVTRLLGCRYTTCPDKAGKASPVNYIDPTDPPFFLYHGTFDCEVPPYQSILMDSLLRASSVVTHLRLVQRAIHGFRPPGNLKQEMAAFLNQRLASCNPTGVGEREPGDVPYGFVLHQNYPNPFNPFTTIEYRIPTRTFVELTILDVLGREVATLVNDVNEAGQYSVRFHPAELPGGVYFFRLQAGSSSDVKKLLYVK